MFGPLGIPEVIFILILALLVFGPKRLPEIGRTVGKAMGEFRRASNELRRTINTEIALEDDEPRPAVARRPGAEAEGGGAPVQPLPAIGAVAAAPASGEIATPEEKAPEVPTEAFPVPVTSAAEAPDGPAAAVTTDPSEGSPAPAASDPAPAATPDHLVGAEPVDTPVPEPNPES